MKWKHVTVKIKDSVAKSEHACWRMPILLHKIAHIFNFGLQPIYAEETPGKEWMNKVKETLIRGGLVNVIK